MCHQDSLINSLGDGGGWWLGRANGARRHPRQLSLMMPVLGVCHIHPPSLLSVLLGHRQGLAGHYCWAIRARGWADGAGGGLAGSSRLVRLGSGTTDLPFFSLCALLAHVCARNGHLWDCSHQAEQMSWVPGGLCAAFKGLISPNKPGEGLAGPVCSSHQVCGIAGWGSLGSASALCGRAQSTHPGDSRAILGIAGLVVRALCLPLPSCLWKCR